MKKFSLVCAAIALVASMVTSVSAADVSSVPAGTLSSMGFGSASLMSDNDGLAVRGKGAVVILSGRSYATIGRNGQGADAENAYYVESVHRSNAGGVGGSASFAGKASGSGVKVYFSGGGSFGRAR